jgi:hypothetical protein
MARDKFGLRELKEDKRDFQLGAFTVLPPLDELPSVFEHTTPFPIKDQRDSDYCSAYSSCGASELQEEIKLWPEYSFAGSKKISGDPEAWGQNLRDACKTHVKHGALAEKDISELHKGLDARYFSGYEEYLDKALKQRKKSYFKITGPHDAYDNIRATLWKFKEEKRAVMIGVIFAWPLTKYKLNTVSDSGFGHAMYITGWDEDGLIAVNSYGLFAGKNGKHRISRSVINTYVPRFGAYTFLDIDRDDAEQIIQRREWALAGFFERIWITIRNFLWN